MDGESCIRKAYEHIFNNDFEGAIHWFEQAIAAEPDNADFYHKCAVSCLRSNKWSKAKHYADQAQQLQPDNEEYRYYATMVEGKLLLAEARQLLLEPSSHLAQAEALLSAAVELDPLSFECRYTLAMVLAASGQLDKAAEHAREALKLDPQHTAAKRLFADIKRKRRQAGPLPGKRRK